MLYVHSENCTRFVIQLLQINRKCLASPPPINMAPLTLHPREVTSVVHPKIQALISRDI